MRRLMPFVMLVFVSSCFLGGDGPGIAEPEAKQLELSEYTLEITSADGVEGMPAVGTHRYKAGERVTYNYSASSGYQGAYVIVDNQGTSLSGVVLMDRNRRIHTGASAVAVVPAQDEPAVQAASQVLVSADKPAAYAEYIGQLFNMYERYGPEDGRRHAQAVSQSVFGQASFADLSAMQASLAGNVYDFRETDYSGVRYSATQSGARVGLIYVNGMFTSEEDAPLGALELVSVVRGAELPFPVPVSLFYNSSSFRNISQSTYCIFTLGLSCLLGVVADFAESAQQMLTALVSFDTQAVEEAKKLAEQIRERRRLGESVILVGHSQGALMAKQALKELGEIDPCVAVVATGSPGGSEDWNVLDDLSGGVVTKGDSVGDFILNLGLNDYPRLKTSATHSADSALAEVMFFPLYTRLREEWRLHGLIRSYLGALESREYIQSMLAAYARHLYSKPECQLEGPLVSLGRVYAVSSAGIHDPQISDLWIVTPTPEGRDTLVGRLRTADGYEPAITDIAITPQGETWVTSRTDLYRVNVTNALLIPVLEYDDRLPVNGLVSDSLGNLYASTARGNNSYSGEIFGIHLSPPAVFWSMSMSGGRASAGDMAFTRSGEAYIVHTNALGGQYLGEVNLATRSIRQINPAWHTITYGIGTENVLGLAVVGEELLGFTAGSFLTEGVILTIDKSTGQGTLIRELPFGVRGVASNPFTP